MRMNMPECLEVFRFQIKTANTMPDSMPENMSDKMSDRASEYLSHRNARVKI